MAFKRLSNHVSPYTHNVVTSIVDKSSTRLINSNESYLLAKQILADLPIVPTGERVYELTQQIQMGLLDEVCPISEVKQHWQECLDTVERYLKSIGVWETF
jgi:RAB protein geranylgeranyltransferase component A